MKKGAMLTVVVLGLLCLAATPEEVNVFIGTGGSGYGVGSAYPGPCLPFGMSRPGPDTSNLAGFAVSFYHCGGYHHHDHAVRGFSQTRLSGVGIADYGNILLMPTYNLSGRYGDEASYRAILSKKTEEAAPGYYAVTIEPSGIRVELTATAHAALHRYTLSKDGRTRIIIDAGHAILKNSIQEAWVEVAEDGLITGRVDNHGGFTKRNGGVEVFFAARLREPVASWGLIERQGEPQGVWLEVSGERGRGVEAEVAVSFISIDQAKKHLAEVSGKSFEQLRNAAEAAWSRELGRIEVEGGTLEQRRIFATAMYHVFIMPTDFTEAGNLYRGFDERIHEADGFRYYTDFSMWDTFRTLHPLITVLDPGRSSDMMQSLVMMSEQGGWLPKWPTAYRYTSCMIGASADNIIADSWARGARGFDIEKAYAAMRRMATEKVPESYNYDGRVGVEDYMKLGYVAADRHGSSASRTIEFAYNDWCISNLAGMLGKPGDQALFMERSKNWRNLWDGQTGYLRGKNANGSFVGRFMPSTWTGYYVEGNARQWLWAPVHDTRGLMDLMGGPEKMVEKLEHFFKMSTRRPDTLAPDFFYWHGNEPDIHASYLFAMAGRPDLTQKWVRWAMDKKYMDAPDGIDGNDDCGTLSAWYVWSSLGIYPLAGSDWYLVGSPIWKSAVMHLPGGDLKIKVVGDPARQVYVKRVTVNGQDLAEPWFRHERIAKGGEIVFELADEPADTMRALFPANE